jgi:hypothetical protein
MALQQDKVEVMPRLTAAGARLHQRKMEQALRRIGNEVGPAVRHWSRSYFSWRGGGMRRAHLLMGIPINVHSIRAYWHSAVNYAESGPAT